MGLQRENKHHVLLCRMPTVFINSQQGKLHKRSTFERLMLVVHVLRKVKGCAVQENARGTSKKALLWVQFNSISFSFKYKSRENSNHLNELLPSYWRIYWSAMNYSIQLLNKIYVSTGCFILRSIQHLKIKKKAL